MFIKQQKRKNGRIYLSVVQGYRDEEGKTKTKHVRSIGYLDELKKLYDDPVAHFRAEVAAENEALRIEAAPISIQVHPLERIDKRCISRAEMGAAIPSAYFHRELGIWDFFERKRTSRKLCCDPCRVFELLIWDRIAHPSSKKGAWEKKDSFPRKCAFSLDEAYRALDYLAVNADDLIKHINASLEASRIPYERKRLYYDVTNYYFEIDGEDEGEDGLRKHGVSKEHRPEAIVQMGLLLDSQAIPIDYELFSGNVNDMSTMLPMMRKACLREGERVVVVADKGLNTSTNIAACILDGNGFVFSQSVRKATKALKSWVLDETGYKANSSSTFKVKSRIAEKTLYVTDVGGKRCRVTLEVKEVAFWSEDFFRRSRHERAKTLEKTRAALKRGDCTQAVARSAVKYAKDMPAVKATGELAQHNWIIDEGKIAVDEKMDGYYCIVSSETQWSEHEIIEAYRGLSRIEESFRVLKSTLDARPVYVWTRKHIEAHFLVCYVALVIMRLMQADVEASSGLRPSAASVAEALSNMVGHRLDANLYHFDYRSDLTDALCECVGIDLSKKVMTKSQMNKVMSLVKKPRS